MNVPGTYSTIDGNTNTDKCSTINYPAGNYCANYTRSGYSKWHLPAIDEVSLLWANRLSLGSAGIPATLADNFWSSTSMDDFIVYTVDWTNGNTNSTVQKSSTATGIPFRRVPR
ncbi:unnamed protein product [marine sediment metagenome]|uniref:DUF1566 domain-containing protein n=1 Tax=marine sediment metagenome TaxID=412755 RepID=X0V141_9ZZZZ